MKAVQDFPHLNHSSTQLKSLIVTDRGEAVVKISSNELGAGMYIYALIVDGEIKDAKRMILAK